MLVLLYSCSQLPELQIPYPQAPSKLEHSLSSEHSSSVLFVELSELLSPPPLLLELVVVLAITLVEALVIIVLFVMFSVEVVWRVVEEFSMVSVEPPVSLVTFPEI